MRERRRKFISVVMMVIMMVTLIPSMAFAEGSHVHDFDGTTHACSCGAHEDCAKDTQHEGWIGLTQNDFDTQADCIWESDVMYSGFSLGKSGEGKYYLTEDITLPGCINVGTYMGVSRKVDLCLNGHVINCNGKDQVFKIYAKSTLNVFDCKDTVHYFTDEKKYDDDEEMFVNGKDNYFETLQDGYDISGKTEGTDYVAIYGGAFTNSNQLFKIYDTQDYTTHLNMYAGTIIGCNSNDDLIKLGGDNTESSILMNGVTIRDNFISAADDAIVHSEMGKLELNNCSIFSNNCGNVLNPRGDYEEEIYADVTIKDSSINNNTINDFLFAVECLYCNVTLKGNVVIKNNLYDGQERNFISYYYDPESFIMSCLAKPFSIDNLTSEADSIGISLMKPLKNGDKVTIGTNAGTKSNAFFSDDIMHYIATDNNSLTLNNRVLEQPSKENNYTFNVYTDDLNPSTYQWYQSEVDTKYLDNTNTEECMMCNSGSYSSGVWTPSIEDDGWTYGLFSFLASENATFKCDLDFNGVNPTHSFQFGVMNEMGDIQDSIIVSGDSSYSFTSPKEDYYSLQGCFGDEKDSINLSIKNARLEQNKVCDPVTGQTTNKLSTGNIDKSYVCKTTIKDNNNIENTILSNPVLFEGFSLFEVLNETPSGDAASNNGYIEINKTSASSGDSITVKDYPNTNYVLEKLTYTPSGDSAVDITSTKSFTMPAKAVKVKATFKKSGGGGGDNPGGETTDEPKPTPGDPTNVDVSKEVKVEKSTETGKVEANVDLTSKVADIVKNATETKSKDVVIDAVSKTTEKVDKADVVIPAKLFEDLSKVSSVENITIQTNVAELSFDKETAKEIAAQSTDGAVITVEAVREDEKSTKLSQDVYELKVIAKTTVGEQMISDFKGGKVTVKVDIPTGLTGKTVACLYRNDKGVYRRRSVTNQNNTQGWFSFTTNHFSDYVVTEESTAQKLLVNQVKPTQNKLKAYKGKKVRVSFKRAIWDKELDKKISDYQVYRSTKKSKGFKKVATLTKKTSSTIKYFNKKGLKKGKKYYYKVRGRVKLSNGEYAYTKWSSVRSVRCK